MKISKYVYLFPLILVFLTLIFHNLLQPIREEIPPIEILPKQYAALDALILLFVTVFSSFLLLIIFKKSRLLLKVFLTLIALFSIFFTFLIYWSLIEQLVNYSLLISLIITIIAVIAIVKNMHLIYSTILLMSMIGVGCILNFSIPLTTKYLLLLVYSIFDILSVYKGFLRTMLGSKSISKLDVFAPLMARINGLNIGAGDIIFYSMTASLALDFGEIALIMVTITLFIGFLFDLWLLRKQRIVPGLPAPIILSLIAIYLYDLITP